MKLYGSVTSPYVRHCRIVLFQTNADWRFVTADAADVNDKSPTLKVPFLETGDRVFGDSSSIIKFVRESAGESFFADIDDYDLFCVTNTILDSAINLFLLEKDGLTPEKSPYLGKQARRVTSGLNGLNERVGCGSYSLGDGTLRLVCFLEWALFRERIDIAPHDNLQAVLKFARQDSIVASTAIPAQ